MGGNIRSNMIYIFIIFISHSAIRADDQKMENFEFLMDVEEGHALANLKDETIDYREKMLQMLQFYIMMNEEYDDYQNIVSYNAKHLLNYGCWCQIISEKHGKGKPKNKLDEICQRYRKCIQCVESDADGIFPGLKCDRQTMQYSLEFDLNGNR